MAFDIGCLIANLLLAFAVLNATRTREIESSLRERESSSEWILDAVRCFWELFSDSISRQQSDQTGSSALCLKELFADSVGFAGISMVRLTIGQMHYPFLDALPAGERSSCSSRILHFARVVLQGRDEIRGVMDLCDLARRMLA